MKTIYNGWEIETDKEGIHHVNGKHFASMVDAMDYAYTLPKEINFKETLCLSTTS